MLDIVRTLMLGGSAAALFAGILLALPIRFGTRLAIAAGIGTWIALVIELVALGAVKSSPFVLPLMFMLPLIAAGLAATLPRARAAMMAIPAPLIMKLNVMRLLGFLMLLAAAAGSMSGPFPYSAGIGDVITGIFAFSAARIATQNPRDVRVLEWNIFGMLDLVVAVALGVTYARGGSAEMTTLPWALIPMVLVPTFLIGHALVFAHIRSAADAGKRVQAGFAQA